jgi:hypothetical protein
MDKIRQLQKTVSQGHFAAGNRREQKLKNVAHAWHVTGIKWSKQDRIIFYID